MITRARLAAHAAWLSTSGREGERLSLPGAELGGLSLPGAELSHAVLTGARLAGCDLSGASLTRAAPARRPPRGRVLTPGTRGRRRRGRRRGW